MLSGCSVQQRSVCVRSQEPRAGLHLTLVAVVPLVAWGAFLQALSGDMVAGHLWRAATPLLAAIPVVPRGTAW